MIEAEEIMNAESGMQMKQRFEEDRDVERPFDLGPRKYIDTEDAVESFESSELTGLMDPTDPLDPPTPEGLFLPESEEVFDFDGYEELSRKYDAETETKTGKNSGNLRRRATEAK